MKAFLLLPLIVGISFGSKPVQRSSEFCSLCEGIISGIEQMIESQKSEQDIINWVKQECNKLSSSWERDTCDFVAPYLVKEVEQIIKNDGSPEGVCAKFHICPSSNLVQRRQRPLKRRPQVKSNTVCQLCEGGAKFLHDELSNPSVENSVKNAILQVCKIIPQAERDMCTSVINSYFDELWQEVLDLLTPDTICKDIGLCSGNSVALKKLASYGSVGSTLECNFCQMMFMYVEQNIVGGTLELTILQDIIKACKMVPNSSYQDTCIKIIQFYGQKLFAAAAAELCPAKICPKIKMCPSSGVTYPTCPPTQS